MNGIWVLINIIKINKLIDKLLSLSKLLLPKKFPFKVFFSSYLNMSSHGVVEKSKHYEIVENLKNTSC